MYKKIKKMSNKKSPIYQKAKNGSIPIWLLRQAGRYMQEYMEIRRTEDNFLDLCYNTEKVVKITMQPINRYGLDSAIIFSDILIVPDALGWNVSFEKGEGPILDQFKSIDDLKKITKNLKPKINNIYESIAKTRSILGNDISLIGFCGSPWTVMSYMLEGKGKQDFSVSKQFLYNKKDIAHRLLEILIDATIEHLLNQISAGSDIVMLFDSWAGMLTSEEYDKFIIYATKKIVYAIKEIYPDIPVIGFPRCSGYLYEKYIEETLIDIVSVDQFIPLEVMSKWQNKIIIQGNMDPVALLSSKSYIQYKIDEILLKLERKNFIFNLGHGILQNTPVENVEFLVNYIKSKRELNMSL